MFFVATALLCGGLLLAPRKEATSPPGLEVIDLRLGPKQYVQFQECLRLARGGRRLESRTWLKARLLTPELRSRCRLRLRGDGPNHWTHTKVSLRVKLPSDRLYRRTREFNLIVPWDRGYFQEQCATWWSQRAGLVPTPSRLVWVRLNGEDLGLYLFLEELGREHLEREERPFSQVYKADVARNATGGYPAQRRQVYSLPFFGQKCARAPNERAVNRLFQEVLRTFREERPLDESDLERLGHLLDLDRWARFSAMCRVLGSHPESPHNVIVYFNSSTGLFEPILQDPYILRRSLEAFDAPVDPFNAFTGDLLAAAPFRARRDAHLADLVLANADAFLAYYSQLGSAVPALASDPNALLQDNTGALRKPTQKELYAYGGTGMLIYQELIRHCRTYLSEPREHRLDLRPLVNPDPTPARAAHAVLSWEAGGRATLTLRHTESAPLALRQLRVLGPAGETDGVAVSSAPAPTRSGETFTWDPPLPLPPAADVRVELRGLPPAAQVDPLVDWGQTESPGPAVVAYSDARQVQLDFLEAPVEELFARASTIPIQVEAERLVVPPGSHSVTRTLIVPRGRSLVFEPGAVLRFAPGASLVSYAPILAEGSAARPVVLEPLDAVRGWGVAAVLATNRAGLGRSSLRHVVVRGSGEATVNGITYTGGLAFLGSDVTLSRCVFAGARGEDALNVKQADARVDACLFLDAASDALDLDWCSGAITGCVFVRAGGDAVDLSGARSMEIEGNLLLGAGDKGVSVGEASRCRVLENLVASCATGVASKDLSLTFSQRNYFLRSGVALAAYQKKPIFGGGQLRSVGDRLLGSSTAHRADDGSRIELTPATRVGAMPPAVEAALGAFEQASAADPAATRRAVAGLLDALAALDPKLGGLAAGWPLQETAWRPSPAGK